MRRTLFNIFFVIICGFSTSIDKKMCQNVSAFVEKSCGFHTMLISKFQMLLIINFFRLNLTFSKDVNVDLGKTFQE